MQCVLLYYQARINAAGMVSNGMYFRFSFTHAVCMVLEIKC